MRSHCARGANIRAFTSSTRRSPTRAGGVTSIVVVVVRAGAVTTGVDVAAGGSTARAVPAQPASTMMHAHTAPTLATACCCSRWEGAARRHYRSFVLGLGRQNVPLAATIAGTVVLAVVAAWALTVTKSTTADARPAVGS